MKKHFFSAIVLCLLLAFSACASGKILAQQSSETSISMETEHYTESIQREITVSSTESGSFSIQLSPAFGKITVCLTDEEGNAVLSVNQSATLPEKPVITTIPNGKGVYVLSITMQQFSGSFDISWNIAPIEEGQGK